MTRSVFYNLASSEGERAIARLRELGHRVAHHAVYPHVDLDDRFDPRRRLAQPRSRSTCRRRSTGAVNVMERAVLRPGALPLGLEPALAPRLPARAARARRVRVAAAADAPGDLGVRGRDDARVDGVDARRRPRRAARAPARTTESTLSRVKPITVMVTASGAPGTAALLRALRENGEREVRLVGTDMSERSVGRHLCDAFHIVPAGADPAFPDAMLRDRRARGRRRDPAAVVVRPRGPRRARRPLPDAGARLEARTRSAARTTRRRRTRCCTGSACRRREFRRVNGAREVEAAARELGYPERPVCFKPVFSSGLARLPHPRPDRRPRAPAAERAARARSRCGSRRRSSCCPTRAARTCS